jgi:hypothetical protein
MHTTTSSLKENIHTIRGQQVMLDSDLARLYEVETKHINRVVKRNIERFPEAFMFQLTKDEYEPIRYQNGTIEQGKGKHKKYLPYAFTEQGVAMLAGVLKSKIAIHISIQIMESFIAMRKFLHTNAQVFQKLSTIEQKQLTYDNNFEKLFAALEEQQLKPEKGIFFDGQVFDAYHFISDIIRSAQASIILFDNYMITILMIAP